MNWNLNYGELAENVDFVNKCENLKENLKDIQTVLDKLLPLKQQYDKMSLPAQIELDLFLAFTLNSLHWINLRIQGEDPTKHPIKDELQRIKTVMLKWKEVKDRDKRPTVDIEAAKRFVRSGLYDPYRATALPPNKKMKFNDDEN
ncbi:nuclear nucleic acid-binding protein C1D-like [Galleria mellonella]|uniref:Nuclear nucleic acid-binding protein C1D n=1 Tax=Galleria mellonella TaxID=7137 RepID=A0A6J1WFD3_GALME|nr:nuclear nucleic acid-binding protein C1D-like [Galleria mellonella]XP_026752568.1 nuclear nucleic acid-binding protein C1D-like [Galleria mellonella]